MRQALTFFLLIHWIPVGAGLGLAFGDVGPSGALVGPLLLLFAEIGVGFVVAFVAAMWELAGELGA